jgi:hypothetical protein
MQYAPWLTFLQWARITFSRLTTVYFTFSVLHCVVQLVLQSRAFQINNQAAIFLKSVVVQGNALRPGMPYFNGRVMGMCDYLTSSLDTSHCAIVWDGTPSSANSIGPADPAASSAEPSSTAQPLSAGDPASVISSTTTSRPLSSVQSTTATSTETQRVRTVAVPGPATTSLFSISSLPQVNNAANRVSEVTIHALPAPVNVNPIIIKVWSLFDC